MATFSVQIPDAEIDRVTSALCASGGFSAVTEQNATAAVIAFIQQTVVNVETAAAIPVPPVITPPAISA